MDFIDYYAVLGVSKHATSEEIDRAYRQLARKYHPDVSKAKDAEEQFKRVNEAHEVLKDPSKRQHYDRYGAAWKEAQRQGAPPPGTERFRVAPGGQAPFEFEFGDAGEFSDFFQELFGFGGLGGRRERGGRRGGTPRRAAAGADQEAQLTLSLEEAARGGKREITLRDPQAGRARTLVVTLPAGVRPGQRIRLAGQGDPGPSGGPAGHLYLDVEIGPHRLFRLDGIDLHTVLSVTPAVAVLGGQARLQTLDGAVKLKIPAGSSSGQRIRLVGKGFPNGRGRAGDLYVEIRIVVPASPSPEERAHYQELARLARDVAPEQRAGTR